MSLCVIDGKQCDCQADISVYCSRVASLRADLAAAKAHNIRLIEAINRLHEVAQGMWSGSESEIADIVNSAVEDAS